VVNPADKLQPRNTDVSFQNNSNIAMDLMVFIFYLNESVIDVETGIVTKYFLFKDYNIVMTT
jgi:hypothetical protein